MCKKRTIAISTIIYLFLNFNSSAQDTLTRVLQKPLSIGFQLGYSANSPSGGAKNGLENMIFTFEGTGSDNFRVKGKLPYQYNPILGIFANYTFNKKISFGTGINFTMRGYTIEINGADKDPEYQFDQFASYTEKYKLTTLEAPFSLQYKVSRLFSLGAGFQLGSGMGTTSKTTTTINQRVEINGESNENYPKKTTIAENDSATVPISPYFGYFASAGIALSKDIELRFSLLKSGAYAETTYGKLSDTSTLVSLRFGLLNL
ncbi:MAG: PorT family protein [Cytophagales bacterium]|uniref:outer membrane beta-barrel protein n=1 Tax=Cyclobacterium marinum TaxID=104 RepID=UPI0030DCA2CC|nr:PorT family protein [Cytophagales bacterium]|tara:strand:+ start:14467 stop:15249 length:783 start_codon:yes stop_codon:yes gene_type:complete